MVEFVLVEFVDDHNGHDQAYRDLRTKTKKAMPIKGPKFIVMSQENICIKYNGV